MARNKNKERCALCGQPVEIRGFTLFSEEGEKKFCCAGCLSIYQLLNKNINNTTITDTPPDNEDKHQ